MKKNKAFTLIEIMTVVIILGVLAGLAMPNYFKAVERRKAEVAKQQLKLIENNISYLLDRRVDIASNDLCGANFCDAAEINDELDMDIHNEDFDFFATDTTITATRLAGSLVYDLKINVGQEMDDIICQETTSGACGKIGMTHTP